MSSKNLKPHLIPLFASIGIGTVISLIAFQSAQIFEQSSFRETYRRRADNLFVALQQNVNVYEQAAESFGAYYDAVPDLKKIKLENFQRFARPYTVRYPGIFSLGYAQRVEQYQRTLFEEANFPIIEKQSNGIFGKAIDRKEYIVQVFSYSDELRDVKPIFGFNWNSVQKVQSALIKAWDTGSLATTTKIQFIEDNNLGFIIFRPIYRFGTLEDSEINRRSALTGFTYVTFQISDAIRESVKEIRNTDQLDFYLYQLPVDQTVSYLDKGTITKDNIAQGGFLANYESSSGEVIVDPKRANLNDLGSGESNISKRRCPFSSEWEFCTRSLRIGGEEWTILILPAVKFGSNSWISFAILGGGLFITFGFSAFLWVSFNALEKANAKLEGRVRERTLELEEAREIADYANSAKSQFLASMSHELRTPLNGILGFTQILQISKSISPKDKEGVDVIFRSGTHLLNLINDILDLSKIEANKMELVLTSVNFISFLQDIEPICRIKSNEKGIIFKCDYESSLPTLIDLDDKKLKQVLLNLTSNAIKFTDTGSVSLKIQRISNFENMVTLRFEVIDTGVGMTELEISKIFNPFEQGGESNKRSLGTGLGLSISQEIIQIMGGDIQVKSELGQGSTFWFDLELLETSLTESLEKHQIIKGYEGMLRRILIVDNSVDNRIIIRKLLEPIGFVIEEASNGYEAIDKYLKFLPDLIITDWVMETMDGFELIQFIRSSPQTESIPIIVASASVYDLDRQKCFDAGANQFLAKPIHLDELLQYLQELLKLSWIYQENTQNNILEELKIATNQDNSGLVSEDRKLSILVIDDSSENRAVLRTMLEYMELIVIEAENGKIALDKLTGYTPDLIITDIVMPGIHGYELVKQIRQLPFMSSIPILISSASGLKNRMVFCLECGANDILPKPVDLKQLQKLLTKFLNIENKSLIT